MWRRQGAGSNPSPRIFSRAALRLGPTKLTRGVASQLAATRSRLRLRNQVNLEACAERARGPCQRLQGKVAQLAGLDLRDHRLADSRARGKHRLSKSPAFPQVRDLVLDQNLRELIFDLTAEAELIDLFSSSA